MSSLIGISDDLYIELTELKELKKTSYRCHKRDAKKVKRR